VTYGARGPAATALEPLGMVGKGVGASTFTGGEPFTSRSRLHASDFSLTLRHGLGPFYDWADPDRYYLAVWHTTLTLCARAARLGTWLERRAIVALPLLAFAVALIAGIGARVARTAGADSGALGRWPLLPIVGLAVVCLIFAAAADQALRRRTWLVAVVGAFALAALAVNGELSRLLALEAAAMAAFFLLLLSGVERAVRNVYLLAVVLSAAALVSGTLLLDNGPAGLVLALFIGGFALKLALVPTYLWLPKVAERTPAVLVGIMVAVVDVTAFAELIALRGEIGLIGWSMRDHTEHHAIGAE